MSNSRLTAYRSIAWSRRIIRDSVPGVSLGPRLEAISNIQETFLVDLYGNIIDRAPRKD